MTYVKIGAADGDRNELGSRIEDQNTGDESAVGVSVITKEDANASIVAR